MARILLCPFILILYLNHNYLFGLLMFGFASLTDYVDGYLARKLQAKSWLGSFLDPVCDKIFATAFFVLFLDFGLCPSWFLGLFIAVLLLQSIGYLVLKLANPMSRPSLTPIFLGKWNTTIQFCWIGIVLFDIFLRHQFPRNFLYCELFYQSGFLLLGVMQAVVFFRYFFIFRLFLVPDFRASSPEDRQGTSI